MVPLEKLKAVRRIIVHGGKCPDGRASAMIAKHAYSKVVGVEVPIEFVLHSSPEHEALEPEEGMLFIDFSVPHDKADAFLEAGTIILDHHRGAKLEDSPDSHPLYSNKVVVQKFVEAGLGAFGDEEENPGVCGAVLAYKHLWEPFRQEYRSREMSEESQTIQEFARLAGIRDTWLNKHPDFEEACKQAMALKFWPEDRLLNAEVSQWVDLMSLGQILWDKNQNTIEKVSDQILHWTSTKGTRVGIFQGTTLSSDMAEYLDTVEEDKRVDFLVGFDLKYEGGALKLVLSTRSHAGYNCASFCRHNGGNGHTSAAGCALTFQLFDPNPYKMIMDRVEAYEAL